MKDLNYYIIYGIFDNIQTLKDFRKVLLLNKRFNNLTNNYTFKRVLCVSDYFEKYIVKDLENKGDTELVWNFFKSCKQWDDKIFDDIVRFNRIWLYRIFTNRDYRVL